MLIIASSSSSSCSFNSFLQVSNATLFLQRPCYCSCYKTMEPLLIHKLAPNSFSYSKHDFFSKKKTYFFCWIKKPKQTKKKTNKGIDYIPRNNIGDMKWNSELRKERWYNQTVQSKPGMHQGRLRQSHVAFIVNIVPISRDARAKTL